MAQRTFLALDLNDAVRAALANAWAEVESALAEEGVTFANTKFSIVPPENLHVTLQFLGDVEDDLLPDVLDTVRAVAAGFPPMYLGVTGLACQPARGPLRMVWATVAEKTGRLAELHAALQGALAEMGFRKDFRAYQPHITMVRVKFAREPRAIRREVAPMERRSFGTVHCPHVTIYTSDLTPGGSVYAVVGPACLHA